MNMPALKIVLKYLRNTGETERMEGCDSDSMSFTWKQMFNKQFQAQFFILLKQLHLNWIVCWALKIANVRKSKTSSNRGDYLPLWRACPDNGRVGGGLWIVSISVFQQFSTPYPSRRKSGQAAGGGQFPTVEIVFGSSTLRPKFWHEPRNDAGSYRYNAFLPFSWIELSYYCIKRQWSYLNSGPSAILYINRNVKQAGELSTRLYVSSFIRLKLSFPKFAFHWCINICTFFS